MTYQAFVFDQRVEFPRPVPTPEPRWWRYVPRIVLRRARATRSEEHARRVQAWEDSGRMGTLRTHVPRASIAPGEKEGEFIIRAFPDINRDVYRHIYGDGA